MVCPPPYPLAPPLVHTTLRTVCIAAASFGRMHRAIRFSQSCGSNTLHQGPSRMRALPSDACHAVSARVRRCLHFNNPQNNQALCQCVVQARGGVTQSPCVLQRGSSRVCVLPSDACQATRARVRRCLHVQRRRQTHTRVNFGFCYGKHLHRVARKRGHACQRT